jgi:hypothetical protein
MAIKNMDVQTNVDLFEPPKVVITENGLWGEPTKAGVTKKIIENTLQEIFNTPAAKNNAYTVYTDRVGAKQLQETLIQAFSKIQIPIISEQIEMPIPTLQETLHQDLQSGKIDLLTYLDKISEE